MQKLPVKSCDFVLIVIEIVSRVVILTEEIRLIRLVGHSLLCFGEIDIATYLIKRNILVQILAVKERIAQLIECKAAARSLDCLFALTVAVNDTLYTLCGDTVGIVHHLDKDKLAIAAVLLVHVEDCVGGSAGACEAVKDNRILVCCDLKNSLY